MLNPFTAYKRRNAQLAQWKRAAQRNTIHTACKRHSQQPVGTTTL